MQLLFSAFAVLLLAATVSQPALAGSCLVGGVCPAGDYTSSCTSCSTDNNGILTCSCISTTTASLVTSSLANSFSCADNIENVDGVLTCVLPGGPYLSVCYSCGITFGNSLQCTCPISGGTVTLSLYPASACTNVGVVNGQLSCVSGTLAPTLSTPAPTNPTSKPTPKPTSKPTLEPTLQPVSGQCIWSTNVINNGGAETQPTSTCSSKTALQGCEYNNFCCWDTSSSTCGPVPGCPNCLALTTVAQCASAPSGCCSYNVGSGLCQRVCPYGQVNQNFCP